MYFGSVEKPPRLAEFEMEIPKERIAQNPSKNRDDCKLMVLDRSDESIHHMKFKDINDFFKKGDVLVKNNTKVFSARLFAKKDKSDAEVEVFLLRELQPTLWEAMVRPARKVRIGNKLIFNENIVCDVIDNTISGGRVLRFDFEGDSLFPFIDKNGLCPLPPYIDRETKKSDKEKYQTVYAEHQGSVAAPTAGMHFSEDLLKKLNKKGVINAPITLHIGLGTFKPILVEDVTRHNMDSEYYYVPPETATIINEAKEKRRRITAVGTSTVRTLETVIVSGFQITSKEGWTDKFIYPPYDFKMCDRLITNFHQPQSTLMLLVAAFANKDFIMRSYEEAIKKKYNFFSYGDAMFII